MSACMALRDLTFTLGQAAALLIFLPPSCWPPVLFCFPIQHFGLNMDKPPRVSVLWEENLVVRASLAELPESDLGKATRHSVGPHRFPQRYSGGDTVISKGRREGLMGI